MTESFLLAALALAGGTEIGTIKLADGTLLTHELARPDGVERGPVFLVRSPYGRGLQREVAQPLLERGIAVLCQDVRGTGDSGGSWTPFVNEESDGLATLAWLRAQPWCDGRVATGGASYLGITAHAMAPGAGDQLAAISLHFAAADLYRDVIHWNGVQGIAIPLSWSLSTSGMKQPPAQRKLPLIEADDATGLDLPVWNDWCRHFLFDDYWKPLDFAARSESVKAPALLVAGWFDLFQAGQIDDAMRLARRKGPPERSFTRLIVGPWDHGGTGPMKGRPDLGPEAFLGVADEEHAFLDRFLLGRENGYEKRAGARVFLLGENRWREFPAWPPPGSARTPFFLGSGRALERETAPIGTTTTASTDTWTYDPLRPCPSYASSLWTPLSTLSDLSVIAARPDVLVFATPPLLTPLTIAGPLDFDAWIVSDTPDTDIAAKLVDVPPPSAEGEPGRIEWRGEGIARARARGGFERETLLEPGQPALLQVRMGHMAATFAIGHRLAIQVTSSNFPRFSRNLNTAEPSSLAAKPEPAHLRLLHDQDHPSALWLQLLAPAAPATDKQPR